MASILHAAAAALVVLALPAAAPSQAPTSVSPAAGAVGAGSSANSYPFGIGPNSYQQVHSAGSFSSPGPLSVTRLRFKPRVLGTPGSIDIELHMGDSPNDALNADGTYANNVVPGTEVNVFRRRSVNLPTTADGGWHFAFPFDTPFAWSGGHLEWRAILHGNSNGNGSMRFACDAFSAFGDWQRTGSFAGCQSALGTAPARQSVRVRGPGVRSDFRAESHVAAGGLPTFLTFGFSATNAGGIPLPFDLTALGATGCSITNDIQATMSGTTSANSLGSIELDYTLPNVPTLSGQVFYTQFVFLQPGANALGTFLSPGSTNTIGTSHGATRIFGGHGSAFGGVDPMYGLTIGLN